MICIKSYNKITENYRVSQKNKQFTNRVSWGFIEVLVAVIIKIMFIGCPKKVPIKVLHRLMYYMKLILEILG